jgi:glycosyltransferase involved in cell wall biosynthesis
MWLGGFLKFFFSNLNSIAILHGSEINAGGAISKKISTWSLSRFNKIIAVSNFTKGLALEKNANLEITVINNGFSFPKADQNISSTTIAGNPAVVSVGNVTDRKGQLNVIKALPYLKEKFSEIHYHIIGIPTEKEKFETVAKTLGVFENVTFHGILSAAAMHQIVAQSKVFFMLSNSLKNGDVEGFGIAVLEANFLGLPAIGSLNTGIADAIKDGFSGKLVSPYDTSEIVAAFDAIMSNYDHYSAGAKQWCIKFDWEIIIKKYLEIIE